MITDLIKRIAPGLATVLAGTTLCLGMTSGDIVAASTRSVAVLSSHGPDWANLSRPDHDLSLARALTPPATGRSNGASRLTGAPTTLEIAQAGVESMAPSSSIVVLEPPRIEDYWMSATRQPGGVVVFDGYVPDEATRESFGEREGADTSYLKLGRGVPDRYRSGADFGLEALGLMGEGRIALRGTMLTIAGTARSSADYQALLSMLEDQAPQGVTLAAAEIWAPRAEEYRWSATRSAAGTMTLAGFVPNAADKAALLDMAGAATTETMTYASGAPAGFLTSTETAFRLLRWLKDGSVSYDGRGWTLTGTARSPIDKQMLEADFVARKLAAAGWSMAVATPAEQPPATQAAPVAEPGPAEQAPVTQAPAVEADPARPATIAVDPDYSFSASRSSGSGVVLSGQLPSDPAMRSLAAISAGDVAAITIAPGAPADFLAAAEAGLRALLELSEGQLSLVQGVWSLRGLAPDAAARDAALASLAVTSPMQWQTQIALPPTAESAPPSEPVSSVPADIAACSAPVAEFSARNAILFQSGAALLAAESGAALDELARDLAACPDAVVYVEGHTDSDGDEQLNMALSVARAEAVVNALIARGVPAARLYAAGYGETAPIADNQTGEGRRLNRRIVVAVQPRHY